MTSNDHVLEKEQHINRPLKEVFEFFQRPENLSRITPPWLHFKVQTPSPVPMHTGARIQYTIRVFGVTKHWTTKITSFNPPYEFVDEQEKGPYKVWHHTHRFEEQLAGTLVRDRVRYSVGWGLVGDFAHALYVRRSLDQIFDYRRQAIEKIFEIKRGN